MSDTFLGMAQDLMTDADAKAAYEADPDGFVADRGFDELSSEDLDDGVGFVAETLPSGPASALTDPEADGDALTRLAQVDPADLEPEEAAVDDAGDEPEGLEALASDDDPSADTVDDAVDDSDDDEDAEDDELDLSYEAGSEDPTHLPDDGDSGLTPFRADEQEAGFGVGYGNEDVDDASPVDHAVDPDVGFHI